MAKNDNRYSKIIEELFFSHYKKGKSIFEFQRDEIETIAQKQKIDLPKNLGDLVYSFRYRNQLPDSILKTAPVGKEWIIYPAGKAKYQFKLVKINRITPRSDLIEIKVPDSTPEIIIKYAQSDEQALLAVVRYNRLIDIFLGITTYSLQNHMRTTVEGMGQIEIDEIYIGLDKYGRHYVIPVQAKGGKDQLGVVQTHQDIELCKQKFNNLICRAISAQFIANDKIALFELTLYKDEVKIVEEKHYKLVKADQISSEELKVLNSRTPS